MRQHGQELNPYLWAMNWTRPCAGSDTACGRLLIDAGADANAKDNDSDTALMSAARNGHTECARLLIDAGADANAKDEDGETALSLAMKEGHAEIADMLRNAGAG